MYHAGVGPKTFELELDEQLQSGKIDGKKFELNIVRGNDGSMHIIHHNTSYNVEVVDLNPETKQIIIKVNGRKYPVSLKDRYDDLLKSLGMEGGNSAKLKEVKAPMPGMVLNLLVNEGQEVEKDTPLVILEAMKMENVIKSPVAGTIKKLGVNKGQAVEKNTLLVEFA